MSEWISVDFAVPPDEREILIRTLLKWKMANGQEKKSSNIYIGSRIVFKNGHIKWRGQRGGYISQPRSEIKVTHWMPLPEEPKDNYE